MAFTTTVTVTGGNLLAIALQYLGDATQAVRIAELNNIKDWYLADGVVISLQIPPVNPTATGGVPPT